MDIFQKVLTNLDKRFSYVRYLLNETVGYFYTVPGNLFYESLKSIVTFFPFKHNLIVPLSQKLLGRSMRTQ